MATLTQVSPVADTIPVPETGTYTNQLNMKGNAGPVTYVTTVQSTALLVLPGGAVQTTGDLAVGTYTTSGTAKDASNNTGTWAFDLTVTGVTTPETSIVPIYAAPPSGIEIKVPFQIDPATGGIAFLTDYSSILAQHIETIVLTRVRERVMLPSYGTELEDSLFAPIGTPQNAVLASDIKKAIQTWETAVKVGNVSISNNPLLSPSLLTITVSFSVVPFTDVNTLTVTTGGTISQVNSP